MFHEHIRINSDTGEVHAREKDCNILLYIVYEGSGWFFTSVQILDDWSMIIVEDEELDVVLARRAVRRWVMG